MRVIVTQLDVPPPIPAPVVGAIVASPGGQANATALRARDNIVTTASAGWGVVLQVLQPGLQRVFNRSGVALTVYPSLGTQIEGNGLNVPVTIANGGDAEFVFDTVQTWVVGG